MTGSKQQIPMTALVLQVGSILHCMKAYDHKFGCWFTYAISQDSVVRSWLRIVDFRCSLVSHRLHAVSLLVLVQF